MDRRGAAGAEEQGNENARYDARVPSVEETHRLQDAGRQSLLIYAAAISSV